MEMGKISIKNVDLHYGDFKALKNINLEIEANKITAFIGLPAVVIYVAESNQRNETDPGRGMPY